jgi:CRISPR-associated protein Cas1
MKSKCVNISLDSFGSFLGREKGCLVVKNRKGEPKRYPLVEDSVGEIRLQSGNSISVGALSSAVWHGIDVLILTRSGAPIATVRSLLLDDSHVETRICQYEALKNGKGLEIAKQVVMAKVKGHNELLRKYGLRRIDYFRCFEEIKAVEAELPIARNRLMSIEGKYSKQYFAQIFGLFKEPIRPVGRKTHKAYEIVNNILNLGYAVLFWKIQIALMKAKLEPYLGFLHSTQWGLPSLVLDFQELYRYLVDDFVIQYCKDLNARDFVLRTLDYAGKKEKRQFLKEEKSRDLIGKLNKQFETRVSIPRIRRGKKQELETLIAEEALLFAKYLRDEKPAWNPRVVALS